MDIQDVGNVQPGAASTGAVSPEAQPPVAPPVVFDEAKVRELISKETESISRKFQSAKDKAVDEVRREAERATAIARREAEMAYTSLGSIDPQAAEQARLRSTAQRYQEQEAQEVVKKQQAEFDEKFRDSLAQSLQAMELDPTDARLDWGMDATNRFEQQKRLLASAAKINKEKQSAFIAAEIKKQTDLITAKIKKDLGVDSVDTSAPESSVGNTDFKKKFANGDVPMTKANIDKYNKILNSE